MHKQAGEIQLRRSNGIEQIVFGIQIRCQHWKLSLQQSNIEFVNKTPVYERIVWLFNRLSTPKHCLQQSNIIFVNNFEIYIRNYIDPI